MKKELEDILESQTLDEMIEELKAQGKLELTEEEEKEYEDMSVTEEDLHEWVFGEDA